MGRVSDAKQRLMDAVLELIWSGSYGSTTIDHICEKAGVKKGSFYYFFDSKSELAAEAFEESWKEQARGAGRHFFAHGSALGAPAKVLRFWLRIPVRNQKETRPCAGLSAGLAGLGNLHPGRRVAEKNPGNHGSKAKYLESAIRDAHAAGEIHAPDPAAKARMILAYYQGLLTQARIQNDVEVLRESAQRNLTMLGVKERDAVSV